MMAPIARVYGRECAEQAKGGQEPGRAGAAAAELGHFEVTHTLWGQLFKGVVRSQRDLGR